jgi:superfamily I DNA/RNA helicase
VSPAALRPRPRLADEAARRTTRRRPGETARRRAAQARTATGALGEAGAIDFGDQVALALRLLREHPAARVELQARFRYILVDEFQDVNRAQAELVALLAEPRRNVAVVGDDDQSIYRFRGAATGAIVDFLERFRGARTIVLRRNYRSRAPILDARTGSSGSIRSPGGQRDLRRLISARTAWAAGVRNRAGSSRRLRDRLRGGRLDCR